YPNPMRQGDFRYVETAGLLQDAQLDFFDFHAYPGWDPIEKIAENYGIIGYTSKPVIMGEVGAFIEKYPVLSNATKALQGWIAESCAVGFGGWIYWGMYQAPIAIGDATWGFMDEQKEMLEALAPINYPDACSEDLLPPENIALNKSVSASKSLSDQKSKNAVDGNYSTQWGSGDDAPQWIKIDLGQDYPISKINLHVAQWPEGNTKHKLEAKSNTGDWVTLKTFSGNTKEGDVLIYQAAGGGDMYRYIKVTSTASPSWIAWKEIEVFK
ncbi:MAG: galactose-binding domain-containing protein, partial [Candidatus Scalindua sp.]